jgi:hypothetical protein
VNTSTPSSRPSVTVIRPDAAGLWFQAGRRWQHRTRLGNLHSTGRQHGAVVPASPTTPESASAFLRCDRVHGAPDPLDLGARTVSAHDVGRRRFRHWSDDLLTIATSELIDRHGQPPISPKCCVRSWSCLGHHPPTQARVRAADVQTLQSEVARHALCLAKLQRGQLPVDFGIQSACFSAPTRGVAAYPRVFELPIQVNETGFQFEARHSPGTETRWRRQLKPLRRPTTRSTTGH